MRPSLLTSVSKMRNAFLMDWFAFTPSDCGGTDTLYHLPDSLRKHDTVRITEMRFTLLKPSAKIM
jgi:hypothetical protein